MIVFIGSCGDQGVKNDSKPLITELEGVIDTLTDSLKQLHNQVVDLKGKVKEVVVASEEVAQRNQELVQENTELKAQLAQARDEAIPAMRKQYEHTFELQQFAYQKLEREFKVTQQSLNSMESNCSMIQTERDGLQRTLNQVKPWYAKWRHDATERNFIERIFGADKAPTPDFPEPQLE